MKLEKNRRARFPTAAKKLNQVTKTVWEGKNTPMATASWTILT